jgi:hypothetical protein
VRRVQIINKTNVVRLCFLDIEHPCHGIRDSSLFLRQLLKQPDEEA